MNKKFFDEFKNPQPVYRSAPFWSVNDKLEIKELKFQVDKMIEGGFAPGFFHSRIGLVTKYLSEDWFKCVKEVAKYSKKKNVPFYLYDEDRWPSGFAGGKVNRKKKNWAMCIILSKKGNKREYEIDYGAKNKWFNDYPYTSLMKKEAVRDFMNSTYETYKKSVGKYFTDVIPAIFTDEPNYFHSKIVKNKEAVVLPWVENFEKIFKKKYGYDILEKIEYLVEEKNGFEKVRYDFYRLLTELFVENFSKQIYQWCEENKISLTGHYNAEDTLESQISSIGDAMAHYEYMQWPGIDHLGRNINSPLTLKQCSSVGNQLNKKRVLSELYGCSGQNFTFYERKWIGDWHLALGINFFCPHLYLYSLRGCRKRDYPPTISHHQPYWEFNHLIEDYFARLNYALSLGKFKANILVIHPVESGWTLFKSEKIKKLDEFLATLTERLLEGKFEYEFGNEGIIEKYGKVDGDKFRIGKGEYDIIIIPYATTLRKKTVELLKKFKGEIFAYSKFPYLIEGKVDEKIKELKNKCILYKNHKQLIDLLEKNIKKEVEILNTEGKDASSIYLHRRQIKNSEILFFANTSIKEEFNVKVKLNFKGSVLKLNPFDGSFNKLPVEENKNGIEFYLNFPPVGSNLILIEKNRKSTVKKENRKEIKIGEKRLTGWDIKLNDENVLVLDHCRYKTKDMKSWSKKTYILDVQENLEKKGYEGKIELLFDFRIDDLPENLNLVVEQGDRYKIEVNGKPILSVSSTCWIDKCFKVIPLRNYKKGKNEIHLSINFKQPKKKNTLIYKEGGIELETIYIKGNFSLGIKKTEFNKGGYFQDAFAIKKENKLKENDINVQGYPFYTGSFKAKKEIEIAGIKNRYFLKLDDFKSIVAEVKVNSKSAGCIYLPPFEIEITELLKKGKNTIEIDFYTSLRNLLGPHHLKDPNPEIVGPNSFVKTKGDLWYETGWTTLYSTLPTGIGKIKIVEKK